MNIFLSFLIFIAVVFAIIIDRMSARLAQERSRHDKRIVYGIGATGVVISIILLLGNNLPNPAELAIFDAIADTVDKSLGAFTAANGATTIYPGSHRASVAEASGTRRYSPEMLAARAAD